MKFDSPRRVPPKRTVLHLPKSRQLASRSPGVEVVARAGQSKRWDFPTVVALYEKSNPPEINPKPDAASLTTGKPASCSSALPESTPDLANDGIANAADSYWATDVKAQEDPMPWWQVDLERPTQVGRVVVVGYYGDNRYYGFIIEGSLDGNSWTMLADRRDNREPSTQSRIHLQIRPGQRSLSPRDPDRQLRQHWSTSRRGHGV